MYHVFFKSVQILLLLHKAFLHPQQKVLGEEGSFSVRDSCHLEQTEIESRYTRLLSRRPQSSHSAVWVQGETRSKHWEVGYTSDTHDKDKSKWEITFN